VPDPVLALGGGGSVEEVRAPVVGPDGCGQERRSAEAVVEVPVGEGDSQRCARDLVDRLGQVGALAVIAPGVDQQRGLVTDDEARGQVEFGVAAGENALGHLDPPVAHGWILVLSPDELWETSPMRLYVALTALLATAVGVGALFFANSALSPMLIGGPGSTCPEPDCGLGAGLWLIAGAVAVVLVAFLAGFLRHVERPVRRGLWIALWCTVIYLLESIVVWVLI
jgi:hypothetical protein